MLIQADGGVFFWEGACGANVCLSGSGMDLASALRWADVGYSLNVKLLATLSVCEDGNGLKRKECD